MTKHLLLAATALAFGSVAHATTTFIDTTALTPVSQANMGTGTVGNLNTGGAWTFTTGTLGVDNQLSSIGLEGPQSGANTSVLTLELWSDTDNDSATLGGTLLATSTNTATLANNAVSLFNFTPTLLSDNTVYAIHVVSSGASRYGLIGSTTSDLLPNSRHFNNGAFVFGGTAPNGIDVSFSATAIPEPSTYGLIGAGALAGIAAVRRRRKQSV